MTSDNSQKGGGAFCRFQAQPCPYMGLPENAMNSDFKQKLFMCFQFEFQRRYKLSGAAGMVTDMTLLQNAEFKEAFDEFDKVLTIRR